MFVDPVNALICAFVRTPLAFSNTMKSPTANPFVYATSIVVPSAFDFVMLRGVVPDLKVRFADAKSLDAIAPTTRVCSVGEVAKNVTAVVVPDAVCIMKVGDPTCADTEIASPIARAAVDRKSTRLNSSH